MTLSTCKKLILLTATTSYQVQHKDKKYIHELALTEKANKQKPDKLNKQNQTNKKKQQKKELQE